MSDRAKQIERAYESARQQYAAAGVDVPLALERLSTIAVSLHCWQGDDVGGFEHAGEELGGGLAVTGNYPGKARTPDELRADIEKAMSLIPGRHRLNLHAFYAESGGKVERNELRPEHFRGWIDWAKGRGLGNGFQPHVLFASQSGRRVYLPMPIRAFGDSGSSTAWRAGGSAPPSASDWALLRHQRLDSRRLQRPARRPQGPPRTIGPVVGRRIRRADRSRNTTSTRWSRSSSASARNVTSSAPTSSTWAMPSPQ